MVICPMCSSQEHLKGVNQYTTKLILPTLLSHQLSRAWLLPSGPWSFCKLKTESIWIQKVSLRKALKTLVLWNVAKQPSLPKYRRTVFLIAIDKNILWMSVYLKTFFTPFLTRLQFPQGFQFLEDKSLVYFIIFPHILA